MKRLLILLIVALVLPLVVRADSLMSITDLRDQVEASGGRWTQTYTSVRGETISVDVMLDVPDVEAFPILRTTWMPKMTTQFVSDYGPNGNERTSPRWYAYVDRYGFVTADHDWDFALASNETGRGKTFDHPTVVLQHDYLDWTGAYAYNNDLPVGEAFSFMKSIIEECYSRYGLTYYEPYLNYILLEDLLCDGERIREKGAYYFQCNESIRGIPILVSIGKGCNAVTPNYRLRIIAPESYSFGCDLQHEVELLTDNVPLLPFESIKHTYEKMIEDGLLRDVYSARLGYVAVYEQGKLDNETFRLIPCWMLLGECYTSAKEEAKEAPAEITNHFSLATTEAVVVNAQTGKIISRDATNKENQKLFNVKTW